MLSDLTRIRKNRIELKRLEDIKKGDGVSIVNDTMFKTMFLKESRIEYCAKLLSCFVNKTYEEILNNVSFSKNELPKNKEYEKGQKCDLVMNLDNRILNVEVNSNDNSYVMERNIEYAYKLYSDISKRGNEYNYKQVIQININNFAYEGINRVIDVFSLSNKENILLTDKIIIIQVYIPNLYNKCSKRKIEELSEVERCLLAFVEPSIKKAKIYGRTSGKSQ